MGLDPNGSRAQPLMDDPIVDTTHVVSVPPPPPPPSKPVYSSLPSGWEAVISPEGGRTYYWEKATGRTSWVHPNDSVNHQPFRAMAPSSAHATKPATSNVLSTLSMESGASGIVASRSMKSSESLKATEFSDRHQCYAILATVLFFPLGLFALYHSFHADSDWDKGSHTDAMRHSRRALWFSRLAIAAGAGFWMWFIFFRGPGGMIFDFRPLFEW